MSANIYDPVTRTLIPYAGNSSSSGGVSNLRELSDVSLSHLSDGQTLTYDATNHVWINSDGGTVIIDQLEDISDVDLTNLTDGQVIVWDATNSTWVNTSLAIPTKVSDLTNDSGFITSASIPTKVSELTNDSGFITKAVNDLVNYYLKSETYSKTEVDTIAAAIKNSRFEVVSTLPTTDIKSNVIYLVPSSTTTTNNVKDEYIYINNAWEQIGSTNVNLSGYVTETELNEALADYVTSSSLTALLQAKQDIIQVTTFPTANIDNLGKIVQYVGASNASITNGYFYKCTQLQGPNGVYYEWVQKDVQPSDSGADSLIDLDDVTVSNVSSGQVLMAEGSGWKNHTLTSYDVNLWNVVNTGDSATPVENGTNKFTTGGAYVLKQDIDSKVDASSLSAVATTGAYSDLTGQPTVDSSLSGSSTNAVQNKVINSALAAKQNTLTFDDTPTSNSSNPVKSGGVYTSINAVKDQISAIDTRVDDIEDNYQSVKLYHNIPRLVPKDVTSYITDGTFYKRLAGTDGFELFEDLYVGDYIQMSRAISAYEQTQTYQVTGSRYVTIAGLDTRMGDGDGGDSVSVINYHHAVMVPGQGFVGTQHFGRSRMNSSNDTTGGYVGSEMFTTTIGAVATSGSTVTTASINQQLYAEFGSHLKTIRQILSNAMDSTRDNRFGNAGGASSGWAWTTVQAVLMSEVEVYGSIVWSSSGYDTGNGNIQLPLFQHNKQAMNNRSAYYWLKDVASSAYFCRCGNGGGSYYSDASLAGFYVRPRFILA